MGDLILDQAWERCLAMWEEIAEAGVTGEDVEIMKEAILLRDYKSQDVLHDCWFCEYAGAWVTCSYCPPRMVDPDFSCTNTRYNYMRRSVEFYQKILELYEIYKAEKGNNE